MALKSSGNAKSGIPVQHVGRSQIDVLLRFTLTIGDAPSQVLRSVARHSRTLNSIGENLSRWAARCTACDCANGIIGIQQECMCVQICTVLKHGRAALVLQIVAIL